MHQTPIDLLDAGMTPHERQRRVAIRKLKTRIERGKVTHEDLAQAFALAGESLVEFGKALSKATTVIIDSISTVANRLKPMLDAVTSDNFDELIRDLPDEERKTLTALRNMALQLEDPDLPVVPIQSTKRRKAPPQQKLLPPPKSVRGKGTKQHHRRRR